MNASDIMTKTVITVAPETPLSELVKIMLEKHISAVPVAQDGALVGIVSEGDLLRRAETGTERRRSRWLQFATSGTKLASEYVRSHGRTARDVMTKDVVTVEAATPVSKIADILESRHIKRVPVLDAGVLVGIVSRANLLQAMASSDASRESGKTNDRKIREALFGEIEKNRLAPVDTNIVVQDGNVHLWGYINTDEERRALVVAAENTPGVTKVEDHLDYRPVYPMF
jgi:CBS domain-containing protein